MNYSTAIGQCLRYTDAFLQFLFDFLSIPICSSIVSCVLRIVELISAKMDDAVGLIVDCLAKMLTGGMKCNDELLCHFILISWFNIYSLLQDDGLMINGTSLAFGFHS